MYFSDIKRISLIVMLGIVGITSFGCQSTSPTSQETQTPATPQGNQTSPIPLAAQLPLAPQANSSPSVPQANQTPSTPQTYQVPLNPQTYQTYSVPQAPQAVVPSQAYQAPATEPPHQTPSIQQATQTRPTVAVNRAATSTSQGLKNLPDGDYFYGELPETNSTGRKYLVFRKTGNSVTGQEYIFQTDQSHCFTGTAEVSDIANVKTAYLDPSKKDGKWLFGERDSIKTNELHQLSFEKAPEFATSNLQECIKIFMSGT